MNIGQLENLYQEKPKFFNAVRPSPPQSAVVHPLATNSCVLQTDLFDRA